MQSILFFNYDILLEFSLSNNAGADSSSSQTSDCYGKFYLYIIF